jgi:DHA1 family tetracycline resistance protein-like MFS transporter
MSEAQSPTTRRRAAMAFIFVTVVLDSLAMGIVIPILPKLVKEFEGGSSANAATVYGVFGTVFAAMQFCCAPLFGALSDRFGRRPLILLSNIGLGLDYILMALAPSISWLFVGRVISGICAASFSIPTAYIADVTPPERRAAGFGMLGAAFGLGFIVGPAFGGLLGSVDPRLPFWVAAAFSLANGLYGFAILPESLPVERRAEFDWRRANPIGALSLFGRHASLLTIAAVIFLCTLAHESLPSMWVLYTDYRYQWSERTVGVTLALVGACTAVVQATMVGPVVARLGERRGLLLGLAFGTMGFAIYGLAPTGLLFAAGIPFTALWGFAGASAQSTMTRQVDPTEQGRLQGAVAALRGMADLIGPGLFTSVFAVSIAEKSAWHLPGAPYYLAALVLAIAFAPAWLVARPTARALVRLPCDEPEVAPTAAGETVD